MSNIKSVTFAGDYQTYDLEVNHPNHQYYLSNGMLTSNSHAVLYSMISYKTAYLKAHYPVEFLLANLMAEVKSNTPDAKANIEKIKSELRANKVKILPPDINKSKLQYSIIGENELITGLDALKFVGDDAIKDIIEKRPFTSFFDFMVRVDSRKVRANNIQALIACGAMDCFKIPRKTMFLYVSDYRKKLQVWCKKHDPSKEEFVYPWIPENDWTIPEKYALEQFYMGESFICKAPAAYGTFFKDDHIVVRMVKKAKEKTPIPSMKGIVKDFFEFKVKKETSKYYGQSMVKATFEDKYGDQCSVTIFPDRWTELQKRLKQVHSKCVFEVGVALHFSGTANLYEDEVGVIFEKLYHAQMAPSLPEDLKSKKVSLKETKKEATKLESSSFFEEIENSLYDQGLIDLDAEQEDN